jgi:hypothetical protein
VEAEPAVIERRDGVEPHRRTGDGAGEALEPRAVEMGRSGRRYVVEHHDRQALARRYLELLRGVAASRG